VSEGGPSGGSAFEIVRAPDELTLALVGELDLYTAPRLREMLLELALRDAPATLDLSGLTFIDSLGIATILAYARSRLGKEPIVLLNASPAVARIFEMLHLGHHSGVRMHRSDVEPGAAASS